MNKIPPLNSAEVFELTSVYKLDDDDSVSAPVAIVDRAQASFGAQSAMLLHDRLQSASCLLLAVYALIMVWGVLFLGGTPGSDDWARLGLLVGVIVYLSVPKSHSEQVFRVIEIILFGGLTLCWIWGHYCVSVENAGAEDLLQFELRGREMLIGLFMLIILHGLFIPNRWQRTASLAIFMGLAPFAALLLFRILQPELFVVVSSGIDSRSLSITMLVVYISIILSVYGSATLHALREEAHESRKLGQYQLVRKLGVGGMGEVHFAQHALLKRPCAIKLIRSESAEDPTALARFELEVQSTARLTHPNVIEIYDYGRTIDGTFYYVMEFLPGMSMDELIANHGPLPTARSIYLLRQICSALGDAHSAGLIHRDLKPANIFISERGGLCDYVKVLDFGLVKAIDTSGSPQITAEHMVSGTPLYMSPEQVQGELSLDGRCDQYAVGAIAYTMLTGRPPFQANTPIKVMIAQSSETVIPPSDYNDEIPSDLERIILRCLEKNADDRYTDMYELERELAECADAEGWSSATAAVWWQQTTT